ncbi:MAG: DnaJ domain-containing protein [Xanthobacteraceae bacterium]
MGPIFLGVIALLIILWALNGFAKANPKMLVLAVRKAGGVAALVGAAFLAMRGQIALALPIGAAGLGMLGWGPLRDAMFGGGHSAGRASRVRAPYVEMVLDHDTGKMTGTILLGRFKDTPLDAHDVPTLVGLLSEMDPESAALLAAYLDRRNPSWREHGNGGAAAGQGHPASTGKMTDHEAQQILGVAPGAGADEIGAAHRRLMKKLHPDQGGSTYLAARVNEAKEVLLRRHR